MMTKEGSTKIVKFMNPRAGVLVPGPGHISHKLEIIISFKIFFSTPGHRSQKGEKNYLSNYRPISLTNIDYKIIDFVFANRLQKALNYLINENQHHISKVGS